MLELSQRRDKGWRVLLLVQSNLQSPLSTSSQPLPALKPSPEIFSIKSSISPGFHLIKTINFPILTLILLSSPHHLPLVMSYQSVSCFGKKKTATAVAHAKEGKGLIRVNGQPIHLTEPEILRWKVYEPVLVVGEDKFS